jgi:hypothetical protein
MCFSTGWTDLRMSIVYGDEVNLDDELFDYAFAAGIEPIQTEKAPKQTFGTLEITELASVTAATSCCMVQVRWHC